MTKMLAGKDIYSRHTEFLIRNINAYLKFADAIFRVLTDARKGLRFFCFLIYFEVL